MTVPHVILKEVQPPPDFAMLSLITAHDTLNLGLIDHL